MAGDRPWMITLTRTGHLAIWHKELEPWCGNRAVIDRLEANRRLSIAEGYRLPFTPWDGPVCKHCIRAMQRHRDYLSRILAAVGADDA